MYTDDRYIGMGVLSYIAWGIHFLFTITFDNYKFPEVSFFVKG